MPLPPLPSWFVYFILYKSQMELSAHCTLRGQWNDTEGEKAEGRKEGSKDDVMVVFIV